MSFEDAAFARNSAPVGTLANLPADQALAVLALRQWQGTPEDQEIWQNAVTRRGGADCATRMMRQFDQLLAILSSHGRRSLMRHACDCPCLGSDEAIFANFIATAATGEREDAMLMAMLLIRPDVAPMAVSLAQTVGLEIRRMAMQSFRQTHSPASSTRH